MTKNDNAAVAHRKPVEHVTHAPHKPVEHVTHAPPPAKVSDDAGTLRPPASGAAAATEAASKRRRMAVVMATVGVVAIVVCAAVGAYVATTSSSSSSSAGQQNATTLTVSTVTTKATTTTTASLSTAAPPPAPLQQAVTVAPVSVSRATIGQADGRPVMKYVVTNSRGVQVDLISIGARVNALRIPTTAGLVDVVAGHDEGNVTAFQQSTLGTVTGRVCSAIPWSFAYNGVTYAFTRPNFIAEHIYSNGGADGFHTKNYDSFVDTQNAVHFLYNSSAGADGIPGSVWVHVTYQLTVESELVILMTLSTDRLSPVDMCSSVAFNLCGANSTGINGQMLRLFTTTTAASAGGNEMTKQTANFQTESDIYQTVKTAFDFGPNYDFTFSAQQSAGKTLLARATCSSNKISVDVNSDQRGLRVIVSQQNLAQLGKYGMNYTGTPYFKLQPQKYIMKTTGTDFGLLMLQAGSTYSQQTSYKFTIPS